MNRSHPILLETRAGTPPRLLLLINSIRRSGAEKQVLMLAESLAKNQQVTLASLCPISTGDLELLQDMGVDGVSIAASPGLGGLLKGAWHLRGLIRKRAPCTVHSWLFRSNLLAAIATLGFSPKAVRLITSERNMPFWLRLHHKFIARWIFARSRYVLFNASRARAAWAELTGLKNKMHVVPNGIDLHQHLLLDTLRSTKSPAPERAEGSLIVGCVGRFAPQKRHLDVIEAAARMREDFPALRWHLVGDGPLRFACEASIRERRLDDVVILVGRIENMHACYHKMDLLVQASDSEGMPNVVMEALAWGVPTVATDVGDTALLLDYGRCGLLVPPRDVGALCKAIASLVSDPVRRQRLADAGREHIRSYDRSKMVADMVHLYNEAWCA